DRNVPVTGRRCPIGPGDQAAVTLASAPIVRSQSEHPGRSARTVSAHRRRDIDEMSLRRDPAITAMKPITLPVASESRPNERDSGPAVEALPRPALMGLASLGPGSP